MEFLTEQALTASTFDVGVTLLERLIAQDTAINGSLNGINGFVELLSEDAGNAAELLGDGQLANVSTEYCVGIYCTLYT